MITFGYRNRFSGLIRAISALVLGVVMFFTGNSMTIIVYILSAFILASGIMSLVAGFKKENSNQKSLMLVNSAFNIILAVLMAIFAESLGNLFVGIIGFVLMVFGIFQLVALFSANRVMSVGIFAFVMPLLVLACGAFLLFKPAFVENIIAYIVGASLIVYGVSELVSSWKMKNAIDESASTYPDGESAPDSGFDTADVKDVEFEKVDHQQA